MKARIQDSSALSLITPTALLGYARSNGWEKAETYGKHSDVYAGGVLPEVILPRKQHWETMPVS